jgi:hypothetical protein
MNTKRNIRIALVDGGDDGGVADYLLPYISKNYNVQITKNYDAEYVIHSCSGLDVLKYKGIRIFFTGEYITPNFNISDYALAFDHINFGDRYCRLPLIKLMASYPHLRTKRPIAENVLAAKTGFCAYVMSNTKNSAPERERLVDAIEQYKPIANGGKWRNNIDGPVADKVVFQSSYKFVLAIENYSSPGYLTEKFADAARSNAVPIFWGDPTITDYINPKAFINCHDFDSLDDLTRHIRMIDHDDDIYLKMLSEPWFLNNSEPHEWKDSTIIEFLNNIFEQKYEQAFRRNRGRWGIKTEKKLYRMAFNPLYNGLLACKSRIKKWK